MIHKSGANVFFICDRRACEKCNPDCNFTTDIQHAKNFEVTQDGDYMEVE